MYSLCLDLVVKILLVTGAACSSRGKLTSERASSASRLYRISLSFVRVILTCFFRIGSTRYDRQEGVRSGIAVNGCA